MGVFLPGGRKGKETSAVEHGWRKQKEKQKRGMVVAEQGRGVAITESFILREVGSPWRNWSIRVT